ncbi:DUF1800 domain-containing protein [Fulvivirgaceae bacterium BMA10]|uniref:DUF1800 domain-containing protein n=1 Tax=Splendidivirga corallicola TaxID=3051826 RepID=A0ABT8KTR0_9BACT|nr:DUF1800 domain-containing protein [Fulvivirgaceae bacterium BMA10]
MKALTPEAVRKLITGRSHPPKQSNNFESGSQKKVSSKRQEKARTDTGLEPYSGSWGNQEIAHLLRRTTFGINFNDLANVSSMTLPDLVTSLLQDETLPDPPLNVRDGYTGVPIGQTWVNKSGDFDFNQDKLYSLGAWTMGHMVHQNLTLREKMALFLHNHFVTQVEIVVEARHLYSYNNLLREYALGNFKELTKQMTINPAMLVYLNGNLNEVGAANENYARELFELFTIGKGEQIGEGDYTNYTEQDVLAAARVLTGWVNDYLVNTSNYISEKHDKGDKQFSSAFDNVVLSNNEEQEYIDLIEMIFSKKETARFICRKLYRWFIYYTIDDQVEQQVIDPLAQIMVDNDYELKPVLTTLFNSAHFFDEANRGCLIKSPLDLTIGFFRQFNVAFPDNADLINQYANWRFVYLLALLQEQRLGDPPSVAGWPAYYQEPQFYQIWINAATLPFKRDLTNFFTLGPGYESGDFILGIDPIAMAESVSQPSDPNILIQELIDLLYSIDLIQDQKDFLKEVLIPGLPDFEWTVEWNNYKSDPDDPNKLAAVSSKLRALFSTMLSMAEYQLS